VLATNQVLASPHQHRLFFCEAITLVARQDLGLALVAAVPRSIIHDSETIRRCRRWDNETNRQGAPPTLVGGDDLQLARGLAALPSYAPRTGTREPRTGDFVLWAYP
jgi:hypothetical protein